MNTHTPQVALPLWLVAVWIDDGPRYRPIAAFASRDEAVAEAAKHDSAMILYRPVPVPTPNPQDKF